MREAYRLNSDPENDVGTERALTESGVLGPATAIDPHHIGHPPGSIHVKNEHGHSQLDL